MDNLCSFCIEKSISPLKLQGSHLVCNKCATTNNTKSPNNLTDIDYQLGTRKNINFGETVKESAKKFSQLETRTIRNDNQLQICQKSIAFIQNQKVYMQQFIVNQITELIECLQNRQDILINQLNQYLNKKLDYYTSIEAQIIEHKKANGYQKQLPFDIELYENDKIMDFSNIKILHDEIDKFGKRIVNKKKVPQQQQKVLTQKQQVKNDKENINVMVNINDFLPNMQNCQLVYKLGQRYSIPKFQKVVCFIVANGYQFGWYWDCNNVKSGYNNGECYLFTLENCYGTLPMKFIPKSDQKQYSFKLSDSKIGFGKDGKDLTIDFERLKQSFSELGNSYTLVGELNGSIILAGRRTNWEVSSIELYQII